jgi:hypothetical protein
MMRDRVKNRPCVDGRSKMARRARARLVKLEEVVPRASDDSVKRRAARFMASRNFSRAYIANQLGVSVAEVEELIAERGKAPFVPAFVGEAPALTDREEAERRRELARVRARESRDAGRKE